MKTAISRILILAVLFTTLAAPPLIRAATTGRTEDTSIAGTEKVLSDSSGSDTFITVTRLFTTPVITSGLTASGSTANDFSGSTGLFKTSTGVNTFKGSAHNFDAVLQPTTNDGAALGTGSLSFSDLFLANGAVVNFNNGNVVLTHSNGVITVSTGNLKVTTQGTASGSVATIDGVCSLSNKTLTAPVLNGATAASGDFDLSGSSGTFKSNTGANTLGGAVTVNAATTPSITLASGKTNTGYVLINGKTSGGLKLITTDAAGYTLTVQGAAIASADRTLTLPDPGGSDSVAYLSLAQTLANKTLTAPVINGATAASGNFDLSGSSGTFKSNTGANTLGGAVTVNAATTPSITTAAGKTNSGYVLINGKTSGGLKLLPTDASGYTLTVQNAAIASADRTLTLPDPGGSDSVAYLALTQTLTNKTINLTSNTLVATSAQMRSALTDETGTGSAVFATTPTLVTPVIGAATGTSLAVTGAVTSSGTAGVGYATGAGGTVTQTTNRSTGVTLNKTSGQITTDATSLAAGAEAEFTVTNSTVAATDTVIVNITPGGTGTPQAYVSNVGSGSFKITITNLHASTADTSADVINFVVIKGVSS